MPYRWLTLALNNLTNIEPHEVTQALAAARRLALAAQTSHNKHIIAILARTNTGRLLAILLRHDNNLDWLIIGARDATQQEQTTYERWEEQ